MKKLSAASPPPPKLPKKAASPSPWMPSPWELADAQAIQALMRGDAPAYLQQRAVKFIVEILAGTYDMSYRPRSPRDSDFAEGKRHVGNQIVKLSKINLSKMKEKR